MTNQELITILGSIKAHAERVKHAVYDAWKKSHVGKADSKTGLMLSAKSLAGAKEAMNSKYGVGSVEW